jgi:AraC-like DNA-binding protein
MPIPQLLLKRAKYYARIERAITFLAKHPEAAHLEQVARVACMERTAFSKFFKRAMGVKFNEFIRMWRIENVIAMMANSDASLTEIANQAGFESIATFNRTFKRAKGITPSMCRRQLLVSMRIAKTDEKEPTNDSFSPRVEWRRL